MTLVAGAAQLGADRGSGGETDPAVFGKVLQAGMEGNRARHDEVRKDGSAHAVKGHAAGEKRKSEAVGTDAGQTGEAQGALVVNLGAVQEGAKGADQGLKKPVDDNAAAAADGSSLGVVASKRVVAEPLNSAPVAADVPAVVDTDLALKVEEFAASMRGSVALPSEEIGSAKLSKADGLAISVSPIAVQGDAGGVLQRSVYGEKTQSTPATPGASAGAAVHADEARVLEASTGVLEVGVASGTHGWLRVRAELGEGGGVEAQVVAASAVAAEGFHKELPAIASYLAHEQIGVSSLVVHAAGRGAEAQDASSGSATGFGQGQGAASGQANQQGRTGLGAQDIATATALGLGEGANLVLEAGPLQLPLGMHGNGMNGGWLSVRV